MLGRIATRQGQSTLEWIGLTFLMVTLLAAVSVAGAKVPGLSLVHSVSSGILCAASLSGGCGGTDSLEEAYGREMAALVRSGVPSLMYGRDMLGLPVDYRTCRSAYCADGSGEGEQAQSTAGEPVTLFTRVVERGGIRYIQYWCFF